MLWSSSKATTRWLVLAIVVMVVTVVPMIFLGPFGLLAYVCGFLSTALNGYLVFTGFVPFVFVAVFVWAVLVVDRHLRRGGRGWHFAIFWIALIVIPVGSFALSFSPVFPLVRSPFTHGFARRMQMRANVDGIRSWLDALDPNDYMGGPHDSSGTPVLRSKQPRAIARLRPRYAQVLPDEMGEPLVRLTWGGGFFGHYGLVVGHARMVTPPSDFSMYGEYRLPLAPGFYAWRQLE